MKIKTFSEWLGSSTDGQSEEMELIETGYVAGVEEAKAYYENDRIAIHEYYTKKVRELMGNDSEEIEF